MKREETGDEVRDMMCLLGLSGERRVNVEACSLRAGNSGRVLDVVDKSSFNCFARQRGS